MESVSESGLSKLTDDARHQGIGAEIAPAAADWGELLQKCEAGDGALFVALDGVTDPRNLGAVLRTARAFGADGVFAPRSRCAPLSPVARKAAAGAAEVLPYVRVGNLARALEDLRERNIFIVGAAEDGDADIHELAAAGAGAGGSGGMVGGSGWCWVLGGEGGGLRRLTREKCDAMGRIPTVSGPAGCLNVSVACGACLTALCGGAPRPSPKKRMTGRSPSFAWREEFFSGFSSSLAVILMGIRAILTAVIVAFCKRG